ncbi:unnamed protein product [Rhodiola kirilowii]
MTSTRVAGGLSIFAEITVGNTLGCYERPESGSDEFIGNYWWKLRSMMAVVMVMSADVT